VPALLALCGDERDLSVKQAPRNACVREDAGEAFAQQEEAFSDGMEVALDENWWNHGDAVVRPRIPADVSVFDAMRPARPGSDRHEQSGGDSWTRHQGQR